MSRQYPIWVETINCNYKSAPAYGFKNTGVTRIAVGSSSSNSHPFLTNEITRREKIDPETNELAIVFTFSVDGMVIKKMWFYMERGRATNPYRTEIFCTQKEVPIKVRNHE